MISVNSNGNVNGFVQIILHIFWKSSSFWMPNSWMTSTNDHDMVKYWCIPCTREHFNKHLFISINNEYWTVTTSEWMGIFRNLAKERMFGWKKSRLKIIENCETKVHGLKFQWLSSFVHCATKNSKFHNIIQCMYLWKYSMSRHQYFHVWYRTCCFSFCSLIQLTIRDADARFPEKVAYERRQYKFEQRQNWTVFRIM